MASAPWMRPEASSRTEASSRATSFATGSGPGTTAEDGPPGTTPRKGLPGPPTSRRDLHHLALAAQLVLRLFQRPQRAAGIAAGAGDLRLHQWDARDHSG